MGVDEAWAAGLFEGEGYLVIWKNKNSPNKLLYPKVGIEMTDRDVLERFKSIVGVGNITGPRQRNNSKPLYTWQIQSFEGAKKVVEILLPNLGVRRTEKANQILELCNNR